VRRRLPWILSRLYLVYRALCPKDLLRSETMIPTNLRFLDEGWATMQLFGFIGSKPTALDLRHLFIDICNVVFGDTRVDSVSASQAGHSEEVHDAFYSSRVELEQHFHRFYRALGNCLAGRAWPGLIRNYRRPCVQRETEGTSAGDAVL